VRCYFIRNKWLEAVYMLKPGPHEDLVRQAKELFDENAGPNIISSDMRGSGVSDRPLPQALASVSGSIRRWQSYQRKTVESRCATGSRLATPTPQALGVRNRRVGCRCSQPGQERHRGLERLVVSIVDGSRRDVLALISASLLPADDDLQLLSPSL
jgi:hypothetical protein